MMPAARQRVQRDDKDGVFLVVWVNPEEQTAELLPIAEQGSLEAVPFKRIRPLRFDERGKGGAN